ncbi:MAG: hypothetical protein O2917_02815 [Acidobacteria bacterium]|nr:hypothetical protein [Acidobacteriota bacterium]
MMRRSLTIAGIALAVFHVWLFAGQVWSGAIGDPGLLVRWLVAAGLIVGLAALKRQGESLVRGRKAVAMWVLAALLHGPALTTRLHTDVPPIPEVIVTLAQTIATLGSLIGLSWFLAGRRFRPRHFFVVLGRLADGPFVPACPSAAGVAFAPRPPPSTR